MIQALVLARLQAILLFVADSIALAFSLPYLPLELDFRKVVKVSRSISFSRQGSGYLAKKARAHFENRLERKVLKLPYTG